MNSKALSSRRKKKIFYEFSPHVVYSERKLEKLIQNGVRYIFIITSDRTNSEDSSELIDYYRDNGFDVFEIYLDRLKIDRIHYIKKRVEHLYECFKQENCLIVSCGDVYSAPVISCFFIYMGKNIDEAFEKVAEVDFRAELSGEERLFVHDFEKFLRVIHDRDDESTYDTVSKYGDPGEDPAEAAVRTAVSRNKKRGRDEFIEVPPSDADAPVARGTAQSPETAKTAAEGIKQADTAKFGKFYTSLRFKLISIISGIIVISLSTMIFLATFFFKKDNELRVNESNHELSRIVGLKVFADFTGVIDKSKLISSAMVQGIGPEIFFQNDEDFIFFGIGRESSNREIIYNRQAFNTTLITAEQIESEDLDTAKGKYDYFADSFKGKIVVKNVSRELKIPVIGISFPFTKSSSGLADSIIVAFVKLDRFLSAFQTTGVIKAFMVNDTGEIIAHNDSEIVLSGGNYSSLPIVKEMMASKLDNGQTRFLDENGDYNLGSFKKIGIGGCGVVSTVNEDRAFEELYAMQRRNIYLMIIVLSIVILIVYFFAKTITTPVVRLVAATEKIKEGDYEVQIETTTRDEIGVLTSSFREMGRGLKERENMKEAFGKFVNKEIAEQAMRGEIRLGGERRQAAVFFSDIRSFTAISEQLEPEEVVEFLNEYMTRMVDCVNKTGGVVDKYIGDAIMAEWGVPISKGNDTLNAVTAALMMREELIDFNKGRGGPKKPIIKTGSGINTGPVLAGQIGSNDRLEYTVIGDTVNLASRIETLNKPFGTDILISQDSYDLVKDYFVVEKMAPIKVKGKEEPQQIYAVLSRKDDPNGISSLEQLRELLDIEDPGSISSKNLEGEVKYEILEQ